MLYNSFIKYKGVSKLCRIWRFVNKSKGNILECNDLQHLIYEITQVRGMVIPQPADLIIDGRMEFTVINQEGVLEDIVIEEIVS